MSVRQGVVARQPVQDHLLAAHFRLLGPLRRYYWQYPLWARLGIPQAWRPHVAVKVLLGEGKALLEVRELVRQPLNLEAHLLHLRPWSHFLP
jgi:hypothetical protein